MKLFNVYDAFDIKLKSANGCYVYDHQNQTYLDFYGGHAVISIGHNHPYFINRLNKQVREIMFYSNAIVNEKQQLLADILGRVSGLDEHQLFLCNSGAEANENALKLASFYNKRKNIIALKNGFHGRTSAAVNITDNSFLKAPINKGFQVSYCTPNDIEGTISEIKTSTYAAIVLEVVQGVGGLDHCNIEYLKAIREACTETDTVLIVDEVQSGFGRTGKFFAHQYAGIEADLITMAKGMGNGFPVAGVLISERKFEAQPGLLGSTFGGNYLACTASISVLEIIEAEGLIENAKIMSEVLREKLSSIPQVKNTKGLGLMMGCQFDFPIPKLRKNLLLNHHVFTGNSKDPNLLRLLPPLSVGTEEIDLFIDRLSKCLEETELEDN